MTIIPALRRLRQKDQEFEDSLGYITRLYLKKVGTLKILYKITFRLNVLGAYKQNEFHV
jgi:hypothetical protein